MCIVGLPPGTGLGNNVNAPNALPSERTSSLVGTPLLFKCLYLVNTSQTATKCGPDLAHTWYMWIKCGLDVGRVWAVTLLLSGIRHIFPVYDI